MPARRSAAPSPAEYVWWTLVLLGLFLFWGVTRPVSSPPPDTAYAAQR